MQAEENERRPLHQWCTRAGVHFYNDVLDRFLLFLLFSKYTYFNVLLL